MSEIAALLGELERLRAENERLIAVIGKYQDRPVMSDKYLADLYDRATKRRGQRVWRIIHELVLEVLKSRAGAADVSHDLEHVVQERDAAYEQGKQVGRLNGTARREKAEAERDDAAAALNRVRALCDEPLMRRHDESGDTCMDLSFVGRVRAAADVPETPQ